MTDMLTNCARYWALEGEWKNPDNTDERDQEIDEERRRIVLAIVEGQAKTPNELAAKVWVIRELLDFLPEEKVVDDVFDRRSAGIGLWTAREDAERMVG